MYLFDLNMSNVKSEAHTQECSKRKVFLKILQNPLKHKKFAKFLRTPFENTNYFVEHLHSCKVLLVNCSFCNYNISQSFENFCQVRDDVLWQ